MDISHCFGEGGKLIANQAYDKVVVCKESILMNSDYIYDRMSDVDLTDASIGFKIFFIKGVAGCGKTHTLIERHRYSNNDYDHLILTSSRDAAIDL